MARQRKTMVERLQSLKAAWEGASRSKAKAEARLTKLGRQIEQIEREVREAVGEVGADNAEA